jgi:hypothetical protein
MKKILLFTTMLFLFSLTGCIQNYELTEEQTDSTAEYMAGLLLKYDDNYEDKLFLPDDISNDNPTDDDSDDVNSVEPTPGEEQENETGDNDVSGNGNEDNKDYTLAEVIGLNNFDIEFSGYQFYESYPEDADSSYFRLEPREGNQYLVASFEITNLSEKDNSLDLSDTPVLYQLDVNVGTLHEPWLTLLKDDLQFINMTMGAGKSKTAILVFEVSKKTEMADINLIVSKNNKSEIIEIK